jgi:hypothetical protein
MFMIHSGPVADKKPKMGQHSRSAGQKQPKMGTWKCFFCFCTKSGFFSAIKHYCQKEVQLPNGNQNSCSNKKVFFQKLEFGLKWISFLPGTFEVTIFSQKLSNYYISLWRKFFFSFWTNFFSFISKLSNVARGHQKTMRIGNMVFGGFPKKIRNKTFYFHCKKNLFILFLLSFGPRVHFRGKR